MKSELRAPSAQIGMVLFPHFSHCDKQRQGEAKADRLGHAGTWGITSCPNESAQGRRAAVRTHKEVVITERQNRHTTTMQYEEGLRFLITLGDQMKWVSTGRG